LVNLSYVSGIIRDRFSGYLSSVWRSWDAHAVSEVKNVMKEHYNTKLLPKEVFSVASAYLLDDLLRIAIEYAKYAYEPFMPIMTKRSELRIDDSVPQAYLELNDPNKTTTADHTRIIERNLESRRLKYEKRIVTNGGIVFVNIEPAVSLFTSYP
jgi:hypothetical protein